jgi:AcrR family transcriptional regulator
VSTENHELRRRRIAEIVLRVITQDGLEAATVRRIAAEVGYSTAVVTYYFADKRDLLLSAFRSLGEKNRAKYDEFIAADPPDLVSYLLSMSALEPSDGSAWRACIAFWDRSLRDPVFAAELRSWIGQVLDRIAHFIAVLAPGHTDARRAATQLFDLVQGASTHLLFDEQCWSRDQIEQALVREVTQLLHAAGQQGEATAL